MKFLAFLRDSYREAVDGFVIYVMLGLSALVIFLAASLSFTPAEPDQAFDQIVGKFHTAFRNRGADKQVIGMRLGDGFGAPVLGYPCEYAASDVQRMDAGGGAGTYKFRLTAKPGRLIVLTGPFRGQTFTLPRLPREADPFRATVAAWAQQPAKPDKTVALPALPENAIPGQPKGGNRPPIDVRSMSVPDVSGDEEAAVTDAMMTDFVKNQFLLHGGLDRVAVKRLDGVKEPQYLFDVEVTGSRAASGWPHQTKALFGAITLANGSLGKGLMLVEDTLVNGYGGGIAILVTVILTAFFLPNLLRKGSLELILSKPVGRGELLLYKYVGGLTFMFLITTVTVVGVWLALSVRSGFWNPTFLLSIPMLTFAFAILYALSTLLAVLTRNAIVCILLTALFMAVLWAVGQGKWLVELERSAPRGEDEPRSTWLATTVDVLHAVLPRYNDADAILSRQMAKGLLPAVELRTEIKYQAAPPSFLVTYGMSLGFITLMLLLAYWRFATRDG